MIKKIFQRSYIALILLFLYAPIFLLAIYSFIDTQIIGTSGEFTFDLYAQLITEETLRSAIVNTIILAGLASVLSTILGTLGAIGIFYNSRRLGKAINAASQIPVISAEIVTAVCMALVCNLMGFSRSFAAILIGHMVLCTPFVVLSVTPKLKQMDPNMYEAALDLGATPTQALFKVVLPEILPGIISGFVLSVTLSLDDYIISAFTRPEDFYTISTYVYDSVKVPSESPLPALRALSTVIFAVIAIGAIIANIRSMRQGGSDK